MDIEELMELLGIDSPDEFSFFEQYAELLECEDDIPKGTLQQFFSRADGRTLARLNDAYFEETLSLIPEDQIDFYTLVDAIGRNLTGLAGNLNTEDRDAEIFTGEFFRFRVWYQYDSVVHCEDKESGEKIDVPVCEALTLYRMERLGEEEYYYEFYDCTDYPLDEYVFSVSAFMDKDDGDDAMPPDDYERDEDGEY